MERVDELKSLLRRKRQEYKSLRDDYEIIRQNMATNVQDKKEMREELDRLSAELKSLREHA